MTEEVRGMGLFLVGRHKLVYMHVYRDLQHCKPGIDPCPFLAQLCNRCWLDFITFTASNNVKTGLKRRSAFRTDAKVYLSQKIFWD